MDPFVAGDHLGGAREVKAERAERQADRVIDEIIMQRQELAVEQGVVEETHRSAQRQHVEREMPPGPPGRGDCTPGEPWAAPPRGSPGVQSDRSSGIEKYIAQCLPPSR